MALGLGKVKLNCKRCGGVEVVKAGFYKNRNGTVQRHACRGCGRTFSLSNNNGMRVEREKIAQVIRLLCESSGIRSAQRITGLHQETILKILKVAGRLSARYMCDKVRGVRSPVIQVDEMHSIVHTKQYNTTPGPEAKKHGNQFTFLSICRDTRLIVNTLTGPRTTANAVIFLRRLRERAAGRFQLCTDAWNVYRGSRSAVRSVFGKEVDHVTEQKVFWKPSEFLPRELTRLIRTPRIGQPDVALASTAHVERLNLTLRQFNRRLARCTLGFSKKLLNLRYSVSLFAWHYNFARKHGTLGTSPGVASDIRPDIMSVFELLEYKG